MGEKEDNLFFKIDNYKPIYYSGMFDRQIKAAIKSLPEAKLFLHGSLNFFNSPEFKSGIESFEESYKLIKPMRKMIQEAIRPLEEFKMGEQISAALSSINWEILKNTAEISKLINVKVDLKQLSIMGDLGWTVPTFVYPTLHVYNVSFLKKEEINRYMLRLYCRNNFSYLIETLNTVANKIDEDYKTIVFQMIDVLNEDWKNYKLCIANVFVLVEHYSLKKKNPDMSIGENFNRTMLKELIKENNDENVYEVAKKQCSKSIERYLKRQNFSVPEKLYFGRHTYLHGRFAPEKVSFADFIRLINNMAFYFEVLSTSN